MADHSAPFTSRRLPTPEEMQIGVDLGRKLRDDIRSAFTRTLELAPAFIATFAHAASAAATDILATVLELGSAQPPADDAEKKQRNKEAFVLAALFNVHYGLDAPDPLKAALADLPRYLPDAKFSSERFGVAHASDILGRKESVH